MGRDHAQHDAMKAAGFIIVRSPLLEADARAGRPPEALLERPHVREALGRASRSLLEALDGRRHSRADMWPPIVRYLERMRGRSTPFSLMAGYCVGLVGGATTKIELRAQTEYERIVRLDQDCVAAIVGRHAGAHVRDVRWMVRRGLVVFPDLLRLTAREPGEDEELTLDIGRSDVLARTLAAATTPQTFDAIAATVLPDVKSPEAAATYVDSLIECGLLVPASAPPLLTKDEVRVLEESAPPVAAAARKARRSVLGTDIDRELDELASTIRVAAGEFHEGDLIFDLVKPTLECALGDDVVASLREVIFALQRTTLPLRDPRLAELATELAETFEGREVPLVELLDPKRGFRFSTTRPSEHARHDDGATALDGWRVRLFERATREGSDEIRLSADDLPLRVLWEVPEAFALSFRLATDPHEIWFPRFEGPPGTSLFARASAFSTTIEQRTSELLRMLAERDRDADQTDIAYQLPRKRLAAPTQYPKMQPFEITLSPATEDAATSIDVNDVLVSVRRGRFELRSQKTGRVLRLRPTSAVDVDRPETSDLSRFLFAASRGEVGRAWSWGPLLEGASRLPRIRFGNHVLSPRRWRIDAANVERLVASKDRARRYDEMQKVRDGLTITQRVVFEDPSAPLLPVDLDDAWSIDAFVDVLRGREEAILVEEFPAQRSVVRGPEGPYHHEIVVPFVGPPPAFPSSGEGAVLPLTETMDREIPGGDVLCVYFWGDEDELIPTTELLREEVLRGALATGAVTHWTFLPYSDPKEHVRLRLYGSASALHGEVLPKIREALAPLVRDRVVSRVSLETYDRETYRYGGARGLALVERIFWMSSEIALDLHREHSFDVDEDAASEAVEIVARSQRAILSTTGLPPERLLHVASAAATRYERNTDSTAANKTASRIFREMTTRPRMSSDPSEPLPRDLVERLAETFEELRRGVESNEIRGPLEDLVIDVLHLHSIRLLTTWPHFLHFETSCYHVLSKLLKRERARGARGQD